LIEDAVVKKRLPMVTMRGESMDKIKNHAKLMAEMIPPLSSAAGGVKLSYLEQNEPENYFDMNAGSFRNLSLWPPKRPGKSPDQCSYKRWLHGDYKNAPYLLTYGLYLKIAEIEKGAQ